MGPTSESPGIETARIITEAAAPVIEHAAPIIVEPGSPATEPGSPYLSPPGFSLPSSRRLPTGTS